MKRFNILICILCAVFAFAFSSCRESSVSSASVLKLNTLPKIVVTYFDGYTTYYTYDSFLFKYGASYKEKDRSFLTLNSQGEKVVDEILNEDIDRSEDVVDSVPEQSDDEIIVDEVLKELPFNSVTNKTLATIPTVIQNFNVISQFPDFPTGCESVSTVMVLKFLGLDVTVDEFVDNYLDKSYAFYYKNGNLMGPDPTKHFVGNPRQETSFGCMAPVIKNALDKFLEEPYCAVETTGKTLEELSLEYINKGVPVITWITSQMVELQYIRSWYLADGSLFNWPTNEHCAVFIGYDDTFYYFADPYYECVLKFYKNYAETRFESMGLQSIVIEEVVKEIDTPLSEIWT